MHMSNTLYYTNQLTFLLVMTSMFMASSESSLSMAGRLAQRLFVLNTLNLEMDLNSST